MAEVMLNGLRDGGTFYVASATATSIGTDFDSAVGKVVAITGNAEVGYGKSGDGILGVIDKVEKLDNYSDKLVATVLWSRTFEDITCAAADKAGAYLVCDGTGGVKTSETATNCKALSVDTSGRLAAIIID